MEKNQPFFDPYNFSMQQNQHMNMPQQEIPVAMDAMNPAMYYEQQYMYYKYLTQMLEYKMKLKEYERSSKEK